MRHSPLVATAVKVTYLAALQVPLGLDGHLRQIIAAEETAYLELVTAGLGESGVDAHIKETARDQKILPGSAAIRSLFYMVDDLAGVVYVNDCLFLHGNIITATVGIDDRATHHLQISLQQTGFDEACLTIKSNLLSDRRSVIPFIIYIMCGLADYGRIDNRIIVIIAVATSEELTDIDFLYLFTGRRCDISLIIYLVNGSLRTGSADAHIAVPGVIHFIFRSNLKFCRQFFAYCCGRTDGTCNIITAKDIIGKDIAGGILTIDVYKGVAAHIGHTGTAKHLAFGIIQTLVRISIIRAHTYITGPQRHLGATIHITLITATIDVAANLRSRSRILSKGNAQLIIEN